MHDELAGYCDLIRLVLLRTDTRRYLSKNNNNLLRLSTLASSFTDSLFLVPLRDPVDHAKSLLSQHRRFCSSDRFIRDYMKWIGHFEFGATHLPTAWNDVLPSGDPDSLDYWLDCWIAAHRAVQDAANRHANILIVPGVRMVSDPGFWPTIMRRIGMKPGPLQEIRAMPVYPTDAALARADEAHKLYKSLLALAPVSDPPTAMAER